MKDASGNEIRYYRVIYTRLLAGGPGRIKINMVMSEWQLQSTLYDFKSRYKYIVEEAKYLPDYKKEESYDATDQS